MSIKTIKQQHIGIVMVKMLASSTVYNEFETQSVKTKEYK
jgi:hypothetical protein